MKSEREKLWSAYLDGELSAAEAAEFDQSLAPAERERLAAEMRFENGLADLMSVRSACPDQVWRNLRAELAQRSGSRRGVRIPFWMWTVAALAAAVVVTLAILLPRYPGHTPDFLALNATDVPALAAQAEVPADLPAIRGLLEKRGLKITLPESSTWTPDGHHQTVLLGARHLRYGQDDVVELLFNCCDEPIKIELAREGTRAAEAIEKAGAASEVQYQAHANGVTAAIVGGHDSRALLDFLLGTRAQA
ncbi:MAG: hypothetical protein HY706_04030 [Candidatus Hydrogenedentes bacterium]|nr:hypothetical protein [Candidatus Hydrogenedentota bacterium]